MPTVSTKTNSENITNFNILFNPLNITYSKMPTCKKVFTIPQISQGGTCWFNALLSALFYSDGTSAYFKKIIHSLRKKTKSKKKLEVYDLLEEILSARDIKDIREFSKFYAALEPRNLLKTLHEKDKKHFYFNPEKAKGHVSENYILMLFQFLGIMDKVLFVYIGSNGKYFFSSANNYTYRVSWDEQKKEYKLVGDSKGTKQIWEIFDDFNVGDVDLVIMSTNPAFPWSPQQLPIEFEDDKMNLFDVRFKADSMLLTNFNHRQCATAHKVAGITCKNKRYLYNGWANKYDIKNFILPYKSCNLFAFDWLKDKRHFCIDRSKCLVSKVQKTPGKKMCFNIDRMKTFIYVRETSGKKSPVPKKPKQAPKKPKGILKKPKVSPDIKLSDLLKKPKPPPKKPKESPDIKLANLLKKVKPKTVLKKPKESPDIKLADLLKKANPKPVTRKPRCPNGTTRNKKTGKCIKK